MIIIRDAQLDAFRDDSRAGFASRIHPLLLSRHDSFALPEREDTRQWLVGKIQQAQTYGFIEDRDIIAFVELSAVLGDGFERAPEYLDILVDTVFAPGERLRILTATAIDRHDGDSHLAFMLEA